MRKKIVWMKIHFITICRNRISFFYIHYFYQLYAHVRVYVKVVVLARSLKQ